MAQANHHSTQHHQYVQANGLKMYYEEYGSGPPLILLHGGTATSSMWRPQLSLFAQHFRVITPDSRGHGKTNNPTNEFSYRLLADDTVGFIEALGLAKPLICGYSDGGQIALEIGMRYPGLATALVVGAAWYRFSEKLANSLRAFCMEGPGIVNLELMEKMAPDTVRYLQAEHSRPSNPDYWRTLLTQISTMWWTPLDYEAEDFHKIVDPTLIVLGDRDEMIETEQALEMYRLISNAELAIIANASHMTATGKLFTDLVLDFLLRHGTTTNQKE